MVRPKGVGLPAVPPPPQKKAKFKNINFVHTMISRVYVSYT